MNHEQQTQSKQSSTTNKSDHRHGVKPKSVPWADHLEWTLTPPYDGNDGGFGATIQIVDQDGVVYKSPNYYITVTLDLNDQVGSGIGGGYLQPYNGQTSLTQQTNSNGTASFQLQIPQAGQYTLRAIVLQPVPAAGTNIRSQISRETVTFTIGLGLAVKRRDHENENVIGQEKLEDQEKQTGHEKKPKPLQERQ